MRPSGSRSTSPTAPIWWTAELALKMLQADNRRLAGAAQAWHPPRQRQPGQGRLPLHGPGLAVREHARPLRRRERAVADTFEEADAIVAPLLEGRRLSEIIFADADDPDAMAKAEGLRRRSSSRPSSRSTPRSPA